MPTGPTTRHRSRTACAPSRSTPGPRHCGSPGASPSSRNASSGPERGAGRQRTGLTHENGEALHPDWISRRFNRLVELSGLPPKRPRDTRHLSATLALLRKADIKVVQERLGHSSRQITSDTYTRVLPQLLTAEAESTSAVVPRSKQPSPNPVEKKGPSAGPRPEARAGLRPVARGRGHGRKIECDAGHGCWWAERGNRTRRVTRVQTLSKQM
ncbi:tyrosine-type recombinase/integrase [Streptomyces gardneri]|uniref:tyrosine-type recombinase/integrase n=1 Tax=Streptomyces gardneri TaxID=66892 RepID=UPI00341039C2